MANTINISDTRPTIFQGTDGQNQLNNMVNPRRRTAFTIAQTRINPRLVPSLESRCVYFQELTIPPFIAPLFRRLVSLEINVCTINNDAFNKLIKANKATLNDLLLDGDYSFSAVVQCHELSSLVICNSDNISDAEVINILQNNPQLQFLDLHNCIELDACFDEVANFEQLVNFNASGTFIDDNQLEKILQKHGQSLTHLDLSTCPALTPFALELMTSYCTALQTLNLHFNPDIYEEGDPVLDESQLEWITPIKDKNPMLATITYGFIDDDAAPGVGTHCMPI